MFVQSAESKDGSYKLVKLLKDMLRRLYCAAPNKARELITVGFLMFENKFSVVLCDMLKGYVTRVTRSEPLFLLEEVDDINIKLLPILKLFYQARLMMEQSNQLIRQYKRSMKVTMAVHFQHLNRSDQELGQTQN